ncbi:sensor histidine kinase [Agrilactobacillus fermenti]|uniref:sensor histidine kinase n=1 Tax=Agrilactobacillus fermenti TaxID=2586909 RepID=UPI003A5C2D9E
MWTCLILIFSFGIGFLVANQYYHHVLKPKNDAKITAIAKNVQRFYNHLPKNEGPNYLKSVAKTGYDLAVYTNKAQPHYYGEPFRIAQLNASAREQVQSGHVYHGIRQYDHGPLITGFFANDIHNTIGVPLKNKQALFIRPNANAQFGELRGYLVLIGVISGLLGLFLLIIVAERRLVHPLKQLTQATSHIASGDFQVHLADHGSDEIGQLTTSFKTMTQQLAQVERSRNEFVANVSHDLQSPLAALNGYADQLADAKISPQQKAQAVEIIRSETKRLSALTKNLLLLATLDQEATLDFQQAIELDQQLREVIQTFSYQLDEKDLFVDAHLKKATITGNQDLLFQVWQNLLTNAIRYAPAASDIVVQLTTTANEVAVAITNFGPPISAAEQQKIFDRFYQSDQSRAARNHSGLGLAIAYKIIQLHHSQLIVSSTKAAGTTFTVKFPQK